MKKPEKLEATQARYVRAFLNEKELMVLRKLAVNATMIPILPKENERTTAEGIIVKLIQSELGVYEQDAASELVASLAKLERSAHAIDVLGELGNEAPKDVRDLAHHEYFEECAKDVMRRAIWFVGWETMEEATRLTRNQKGWKNPIAESARKLLEEFPTIEWAEPPMGDGEWWTPGILSSRPVDEELVSCENGSDEGGDTTAVPSDAGADKPKKAKKPRAKRAPANVEAGGDRGLS